VSQPDATGKVYALLTISDATLTVTIRMPWENAGQFGMGLAQGLAAIQQKAEGMAHKGLALPNGGQPNRLILPGTVAR
jgi:hypothetical protein